MTTSKIDNGAMPTQYRAKGGKLRPSQLITTFGPGAVVDLPEDSVMVAGLDQWPIGTLIREHRLEQLLGVKYFRGPSMQRFEGDVPCVRFPRNLVCSSHACGRISWKKKCPDCGHDTYPARIIVICPAGHADDFPWEWWTHRTKKCTGKPILRLKSTGRTAALADLIVSCDTCQQKQSLAGALGQHALGNHTCDGYRPWLPGAPAEICNEKPRSVLRGASNVYFSSLLSALSIPPWTSPIQQLLDDHWQTLAPLDDTTRKILLGAHPDFVGLNVDDVLKAIHERLASTTTSSSLRKDEFQAFRNPGSGITNADFQIKAEPVPATFKDLIEKIVLVSRLREVRVLRGFTRIDPPDSENSTQALAEIAQTPQPWLPAVEHRGEGIFIELPENRVAAWETRPEVQKRIQRLHKANNAWRIQRGMQPAQALLPRLVLLHTLSHLFIRQLSLDCGYSSSSLRERIYSGSDMSGLLIYTATADSDGSLGGLVQQGRTGRFEATLRALLDNAQWCSSDPLCTEHDPSRTGRLNGATCHACGLVSETSCEYANRLLDRALIRDLVGVSLTGYFITNDTI